MEHAIFVYGTLKRGFCRASCWPKRPLQVTDGFVRGTLLDLHDYPGLVPGDGWVRGEVWYIAEADWDTTIAVLDAVEGYRQTGEHDWYVRQLLNVFAAPEGAFVTQAETYVLADRRLIDKGVVMEPEQTENGTLYTEWTRQTQK